MSTRQTKIREAAYYKWKEAGQPDGNELKFWLEAEQDQKDTAQMSDDESVDEMSEESFPASDPPGRGISKVGAASRRSR